MPELSSFHSLVCQPHASRKNKSLDLKTGTSLNRHTDIQWDTNSTHKCTVSSVALSIHPPPSIISLSIMYSHSELSKVLHATVPSISFCVWLIAKNYILCVHETSAPNPSPCASLGHNHSTILLFVFISLDISSHVFFFLHYSFLEGSSTRAKLYFFYVHRCGFCNTAPNSDFFAYTQKRMTAGRPPCMVR